MIWPQGLFSDVQRTLEERFGVTFADDELDGSAFATVRSLVALVESKLGA